MNTTRREAAGTIAKHGPVPVVMPVEDLLRRCVSIIRRRLPGEEWGIWVFGSQADGRAHAGSDLDLAVAGPRPIPLTELGEIREEIEQIPTLRSVDIVDLSAAGTRLFRSVISRGRRVA